MKTIIAVALCLLTSFAATAATETNKTITSVGAQDNQDGTRAYMALSPPTTANCLYSVVYIKDLNTVGGTGLYAALLKAFSLSKLLQRIDYDQDSVTGQCNVTLLQFGG